MHLAPLRGSFVMDSKGEAHWLAPRRLSRGLGGSRQSCLGLGTLMVRVSDSASYVGPLPVCTVTSVSGWALLASRPLAGQVPVAASAPWSVTQWHSASDSETWSGRPCAPGPGPAGTALSRCHCAFGTSATGRPGVPATGWRLLVSRCAIQYSSYQKLEVTVPPPGLCDSRSTKWGRPFSF